MNSQICRLKTTNWNWTMLLWEQKIICSKGTWTISKICLPKRVEWALMSTQLHLNLRPRLKMSIVLIETCNQALLISKVLLIREVRWFQSLLKGITITLRDLRMIHPKWVLFSKEATRMVTVASLPTGQTLLEARSGSSLSLSLCASAVFSNSSRHQLLGVSAVD